MVKKDLEEFLTADNSRIAADKTEYFSPLDLSGENMSSLREAEVGLRKWSQRLK